MADDATARYHTRLAEKLADGLAAPLPEATPRRIHGDVHLKGKATAVVGMRRAGFTAARKRMLVILSRPPPQRPPRRSAL